MDVSEVLLVAVCAVTVFRINFPIGRNIALLTTAHLYAGQGVVQRVQNSESSIGRNI